MGHQQRGRHGLPGGAFVAAALSFGAAWWWLTGMLAPGAVGTGHGEIDLAAAVVTGGLVGLASHPVYIRLHAGHLVWLSVVSLYLAAALHGVIAFILKLALLGVDVVGTSWARGEGNTVHHEGPAHAVEIIFATWWGLSLPVFLLVLLPLSLATHAILRRLARLPR